MGAKADGFQGEGEKILEAAIQNKGVTHSLSSKGVWGVWGKHRKTVKAAGKAASSGEI